MAPDEAARDGGVDVPAVRGGEQTDADVVEALGGVPDVQDTPPRGGLMNELERHDEIEARLGRVEAIALDALARVQTLERACVHQLETRSLLDRVGVHTGIPVGTTSDNWHDPDKGGSWEGSGA